MTKTHLVKFEFSNLRFSHRPVGEGGWGGVNILGASRRGDFQ